VLRSTFLWLSENPGIFRFVKRNRLARRIALRFVAGETLDAAIEGGVQAGTQRIARRSHIELLHDVDKYHAVAGFLGHDTFDNAEHTAASGIDCSTYARLITSSFTLTDGVLTVTV